MIKKQSLAIMFTLILMLSCLLSTVNGLAYVTGDVNGDGSFNSLDFGQFKMYLLGSSLPYPDAGDVNSDGVKNSIDFGYMRQYLLGIIPSFPVNQTPTPATTPTPVTSAYPTSAGVPTVYLASDSTVQTYNSSYYPQAGWGQMISNYFTSDVKFVNKAIGGRSSKSFVVEGRLDEILKVIKKGDYLFVQFGHNDATVSKPERYAAPYTTYKEYLAKYIDGAREKGAIPVLITPVARLNYKNSTYKNDFPDYCTAMKQVADEKDCAIIDLMTKTLDYYATLDYNTVYKFYMVSSNGTDYTHFTETGAKEVAKIVSQGVKEINVPISKYVK
ncbi:SGNH/GDSL hydrolase family protein [Acetivibrio cellulolyticus]|uniref:SGNH/GDSL hydrolase family protein n=1 Tax=Acetivibrio cellulolyticus TaxID=35830 RepID=UPI0001E2D948